MIYHVELILGPLCWQWYLTSNCPTPSPRAPLAPAGSNVHPDVCLSVCMCACVYVCIYESCRTSEAVATLILSDCPCLLASPASTLAFMIYFLCPLHLQHNRGPTMDLFCFRLCCSQIRAEFRGPTLINAIQVQRSI